MSSSDLHRQYREALDFIRSQIPAESDDGRRIQKQIIERLESEWDKPRVAAWQFGTQQSFSGDRARRALFYPAAEDAPAIVALLCPLHESMPKDHEIRKLQASVLAVTYLRHTNPARPWETAANLVLAGGFEALAGHVASPDPVIRSQALATMVALTAHPGFDWFAPAVGPRDRALHAALLALAPPRSLFVVRLAFDNFEPVFPGSSLLALQLLAFWLSWARRLYSTGGVLRLSKAVLDRLREWAEDPDEGERGRGAGEGAGDPALQRSEQERDLAKRLVEDFGRFGAAEEHGGGETGTGGDTAAVQGVVGGSQEGQASCIEEVPLVVRGALTTAETNKDAANQQYARGYNRLAERGYTDAIAALAQCRAAASKEPGEGDNAKSGASTGSQEQDRQRQQELAPSVGPALATLHSNRAAARLKMASEAPAGDLEDLSQGTSGDAGGVSGLVSRWSWLWESDPASGAGGPQRGSGGVGSPCGAGGERPGRGYLKMNEMALRAVLEDRKWGDSKGTSAGKGPGFGLGGLLMGAHTGEVGEGSAGDFAVAGVDVDGQALPPLVDRETEPHCADDFDVVAEPKKQAGADGEDHTVDPETGKKGAEGRDKLKGEPECRRLKPRAAERETKRGDHRNALQLVLLTLFDCARTLALEPGHCKALHRRARALALVPGLEDAAVSAAEASLAAVRESLARGELEEGKGREMERDGEVLARRMRSRAEDRKDAMAAEGVGGAGAVADRDGVGAREVGWSGGGLEAGLAGGVLAALLRREDFGGSGVGIGAGLEEAERRLQHRGLGHQVEGSGAAPPERMAAAQSSSGAAALGAAGAGAEFQYGQGAAAGVDVRGGASGVEALLAEAGRLNRGTGASTGGAGEHGGGAASGMGKPKGPGKQTKKKKKASMSAEQALLGAMGTSTSKSKKSKGKAKGKGKKSDGVLIAGLGMM